MVGALRPMMPEIEMAGWWLCGWLRAYQETPEEHAQLIPRMIAAEERHERAAGGWTEAVNRSSPTDDSTTKKT